MGLVDHSFIKLSQEKQKYHPIDPSLGDSFFICFFLLRNRVCLLLVKAGGCSEKWRSHGQRRKPFSENEWIVIPELLPVIHMCFFLCHLVCSAVILKPSTSTSTFHFIIVPKLWRSLTVCTCPSKRLANFNTISKKVCKRNVKGHVFPSTTLCSVVYRKAKDDIIQMNSSQVHTAMDTQEYTLHFFPSHFITFFYLDVWQVLHLSQDFFFSFCQIVACT